jgi:rare lipoprotein A
MLTSTALPVSAAPYKCSSASHYGHGDGYHGQRTANGESFNAYGYSTAHRTLPFGTRLLVRNPANGRTVTVRVNDRGPFVGYRDLDLSYAAFGQLTSPSRGVTRICYSII